MKNSRKLDSSQRSTIDKKKKKLIQSESLSNENSDVLVSAVISLVGSEMCIRDRFSAKIVSCSKINSGITTCILGDFGFPLVEFWRVAMSQT